ncbi:MAG: hypothetical protein U0792_06860 [Gemmataceae bacterium]
MMPEKPMEMPNLNIPKLDLPKIEPEAPPEPPVFVELRKLVAKAKKGDVTALPRIREILDTHEDIWKHVGDVERLVTKAWAEELGGRNPIGVESIRRKADEMRRELEGESPTPLEKLMVGQVVATWLAWQDAQLAATGVTSPTGAQTDHINKRLAGAQRRHLEAIKSLTTTRTLLPQGLVPMTSLRLFSRDEKRRRA